MTSAPALFGPAARIDVVGLGAGTLGCYAQPGQAWRFFEIDPVIVTIAKTRFTFLSQDTITKLVASSPAGSWETLVSEPATSAWTDEHATILPNIKWRTPKS